MDFLSLSWWRKVYATGGRVFAIGCALVFIIPIVITAGFMNHGSSPAEVQQTGTIATVNGSPISARDLGWVPSENLGGAAGKAHADKYGAAIYSLIVHKVVEQVAKKQGVHATDAEVDRAVAKSRVSKVGPTATDVEWENYLSERHHASLAEFRDYMSSEANVEALLEHYKSAENVTHEDAQKQITEVKVAAVFIPSKATGSPFPGGPKALPDAEALKKATELRAKVLAGADILPLAKANSGDFQPNPKSTGISDWQKEYQESQFGSLMFGKDVDAAVQKTATGQVSDIAKATGFRPGYYFAKVMERRVTPPDKYDEKKAIATLKEQRAYKKLDDDIKAAVKVAKIEFPKDQIDKKAYYDYAKLQVLQQEMQGSMLGTPAADAPTQADIQKQQEVIDADFEALLKKTPEDTTAILMVASAVQTKMSKSPLTEQPALRDRLISLYESAFKSTEDISTRFTLAGLYSDKKDYKSAFTQYTKIIKLLDDDPPYDLNSREKELPNRQKALTGLRSFAAADVPEAAVVITEQLNKIAALTDKINEDKIKQAAERKLQDEQQKTASKTPPPPSAPSIKVKPGTSTGAVPVIPVPPKP